MVKTGKQEINLYNLKKPIDCLKLRFKLVIQIFARIIVGKLQKKIIVFGFWLGNSISNFLEKVEFSNLMDNLENYQKYNYRFIKKGQWFSRTIYTLKSWLSLMVLSHRFRGSPLILMDIFETRSNRNKVFF